MHDESDGISYARSKLANVLHAWALPLHRKHVTALSINLGWVGTNIQPWMKYLKPFWLIRDPKFGVSPIVHGIVSNVPKEMNGFTVSGVLELSMPLTNSNRMLQVAAMNLLVKQIARFDKVPGPMRTNPERCRKPKLSPCAIDYGKSQKASSNIIKEKTNLDSTTHFYK